MTNEEIIKKLHSLLKPVQQEMFTDYYSADSRKYVEHCARRLGKTFFLCIVASITAYYKPGAQIRYGSVTQKAVRKMLHPIMKFIWSSFPIRYRPRWNSQEGAYIFKNESMIHCAGVNNQGADDLRGTYADLAIVDEAGFVDELSYLVDSVLVPQLFPTPENPSGGRLIMASSSPLSPAHEFTDYIHEARKGGFYSAYDITQGGYTEETVNEFIAELGGPDSTATRRELFNELIVDEEFQIIPEWRSEYAQERPRDEYFQYYQGYAAMDTGFKDLTAILFGYYDFKNATLVIEDEESIKGREVTSENIANTTKSKESELKYSKITRVADNNDLIFLNDLSATHQVTFNATNKDSLHAMVNEVREWVKSGRLIVNPKCKQLLGCLEYGVWDKNRKAFDRSKVYGHYDALAALIYMIRNIDQHTNPIPITHNATFNTHIPHEEPENIQVFKQLFNKR